MRKTKQPVLFTIACIVTLFDAVDNMKLQQHQHEQEAQHQQRTGVRRSGFGFDPYMNEAPLGPETGCLMHTLGYEYALTLLPERLSPTARARQQVWDAFFTGDMMQEGMGNCSVFAPPRPQGGSRYNAPSYFTGDKHVFVDYGKGNDETGDGSLATPFKTIARGLTATRMITPTDVVNVYLVLRAGIHTLMDSLALGPQDEGLVIQNYAAEEVWISGAQALPASATWTQFERPLPGPANATCTDVCVALGHCCVGTVSSYLHPSCAMGCQFAELTETLQDCVNTCDTADGHASITVKNETFNMGGSCPTGCSAEDGKAECYLGCKLKHNVPLYNIWETDISSLFTNKTQKVWGVHVLNDEDVWHTVLTKARFPNRDGVNDGSREGNWANIGDNATWSSQQPVHFLGHQIVENATKYIPKNVTVFPDYYVYGTGGACARAGYDPPGGYLCSIHGGMHGGDWDGTKWTCPGCTDGYPTVFPSALVLKNTTDVNVKQKTFPNSHLWPKDNETLSKAILRTWVNGWFTEMWNVAGWNEDTATLDLGYGGFHGGQPHMLDSVNPDGTPGGPDEFLNSTVNVTNRLDPSSMGQVIIENLLAELDFPEEFYIDEENRKLYYFYNGTGKPPTSHIIGLVTLQNLIQIQGSEAGPSKLPSKPAKNIQIRGIGIRDAGYTYMNPHGAPSGGDWGMQSPQYPQAGALYLAGTENITIENCVFKYLDGNAVFLAGYNRNTTVANSELTQIGDSPIALWGYTKGTDPEQPEGTGIDGSDGNQPRGTRVVSNLCHEYGFFQKQSSCVFMAKSMETTITGNIMFNAARAHINQNDGFGGGSTISKNLIFSSCRESSDHGPFNSWDRQPFIWERKNISDSIRNVPNLTPKPIVIENNFIFANYGAGQSVDNDDGSSYYDIKNNVMYAAGGLKSDYAGHDKVYHGNLQIGGGGCGMYNYYQMDHQDQCYNNTFILPHPRPHSTSQLPSQEAWADLRGCDATQQKPPRCGILQNPYGGGPAPIMTVHSNSIYNHNESAPDVQCGSQSFTALEFAKVCGVNTTTTTTSTLPSQPQISQWVKQWLGM
eukprot:m.8181 g.8181  ORF g.8181 m.8181 type:complete len:1067 (-) comp3851_c0_seq2:220-3420(-)